MGGSQKMIRMSLFLLFVFVHLPGLAFGAPDSTESSESTAALPTEVLLTPATKPQNLKSNLPPASDRASTNWEVLVEYDKGQTSGPRSYKSAEYCSYAPKPCIITEDSVIKFNIPEADTGRYDIELKLLHRGSVVNVDFMEKNSFHDYVIIERIYNRARNRHVWSLMDRIEKRIYNRLHLFGLSLQYEIDDGDPLILQVRELNNPSNEKSYFFRYHKSDLRVLFDIALLVPIDAAQFPKPALENSGWKNGSLSAALTVGFSWTQDPETSYPFYQKVFMAGYPAFFLGPVQRVLKVEGYENMVRTDLYLGAGFTYFHCLFFGWGFNVIHVPRVSTPFVGINIGKAIEFIAEINDSSPEAWDSYIERERDREGL